MMNYMRPPTHQPVQNNGERNFGSDLHSFMDGLNRIVQILYSSIPVLELLRMLFKYTVKFCHYLGMNTVSLFCSSSRAEALLEQTWLHNAKKSWHRYGKFGILLALAAGVLWAYNRHNEIDMLEDAWEEEFQEEQSDDPIDQRDQESIYMHGELQPYGMDVMPQEQYGIYY